MPKTLPPGPDQFSSDQSDITSTRPDVENAHSRSDTRQPKETFSRWPHQFILPLQARPFGVRAPEPI
jgi:hypothetical protein